MTWSRSSTRRRSSAATRARSRRSRARSRLATAELRAANEQLQSLDHLKDDFMSSVTHELRTPLTSIRALSELMLDTPDMEAAQREEFLRIVVSESERLSRLVNQVLDMAKIESGPRRVAQRRRRHARPGRERRARHVRALPRARRRGRARPARPRAADPRRSRPADAGHGEPAVQRRQVRPGRGRAGSTSCCAARATASSSRCATTARGCRRPSRRRVFEKFRQGGDALARPPGPASGFRSAGRSSIISAAACGWSRNPAGARALPSACRCGDGRETP